jgi:hypothetical protein
VSHLDDLILDVDEGDRSRVTVDETGREAYEAKITLTQEGFERLRQGYLCGRCLEDLRPLGAFPERCPCCGFPVREEQVAQLAKDFVGSEQIGSGLSLSDELVRLGDMWMPGDPI